MVKRKRGKKTYEYDYKQYQLYLSEKAYEATKFFKKAGI